MNLQYRIDLLHRLGEYILSDDNSWQAAKEKAERENPWFTPAFINHAAGTVAKEFLTPEKLQKWVAAYPAINNNQSPKNVGVVMAGNIPMVGFHDLLAVFVSGHRAIIKLSSKDKVLINHLTEKLTAWEPACGASIQIAEMLKGCDAYIATGSNNSSRYFEYYFAKFPHIIRRNRTSVAILNGQETKHQLEKLADDVHLYFGLGCRNITKIYVPEEYDFVPLIEAFSKYNYLADHHKFKNNYDYNLALHILNRKYYMSTGALLVIEDPSVFSPVSQLHYSFYTAETDVAASLKNNDDIQCIVGEGCLPFGETQHPSLTDYADGVDTLHFLATI